MAKLGSRERPAVVRVQTHEKAEEVLGICTQNGWQVIVGVETDKPEDLADLTRLQHPPQPLQAEQKTGRNDPCVCGSGLKYKKCCGR